MNLTPKTRTVLVGLLLPLAACGVPDSGTVVDKDHRAAYYTTSWRDCGTTERPRRCQEQNYHPATYRVLVRADNGQEEGWASVTSGTYDTCGVGDRWHKAEGWTKRGRCTRDA